MALSEEEQKAILLNELCGTGRSAQTVIDVVGVPSFGTASARPGAPAVVEDLELIRQAGVYWKLGVDRLLGLDRFEDYLATLPPAPRTQPTGRHSRLVLQESRIVYDDLCQLADIGFGGYIRVSYDLAVPYDPRHAHPSRPGWIWVDPGTARSAKSAREARPSLGPDETALTLHQGICTVIQHRDVIPNFDRSGGRMLLLAGTVDHTDGGAVTFIWRRSTGVSVGWTSTDWSTHKAGVASCIRA